VKYRCIPSRPSLSSDIDLKRGWLQLAVVLGSREVGEYVARLGGFADGFGGAGGVKGRGRGLFGAVGMSKDPLMRSDELLDALGGVWLMLFGV
jgi:hypothetical protein